MFKKVYNIDHNHRHCQCHWCKLERKTERETFKFLRIPFKARANGQTNEWTISFQTNFDKNDFFAASSSADDAVSKIGFRTHPRPPLFTNFCHHDFCTNENTVSRVVVVVVVIINQNFSRLPNLESWRSKHRRT